MVKHRCHERTAVLKRKLNDILSVKLSMKLAFLSLCSGIFRIHVGISCSCLATIIRQQTVFVDPRVVKAQDRIS